MTDGPRDRHDAKPPPDSAALPAAGDSASGQVAAFPRGKLLPRLGLIVISLEVVAAGALLVYWSGSGAGAAAAEAAPSLILSTVALVLATAAVVWAASRRLSRGLARLESGARQFAETDFRHRIEPPPQGELAKLVRSLNEMAMQLNERVAEIHRRRGEQQAIVQSLSSAVIALDQEQRLLSVNRAAERMLGIDGQAQRGRLLQEVVRQAELNRFVAGALEDPANDFAEFTLEGENPATVEATAQPLRDGRDTRVGLVVLMDDVTRLRRLEAVRSDFAANVSHELRTPITNIRGYVETLLDVGVQDPQQAARFLGIVQRSADRLAAIVEDLLALARLEQPGARSTLLRAATPVRFVVAAAIAQQEPAARDKGIAVETDIPSGLSVMVNAALVEQAIVNLLSNAIKYSAGQTAVQVSGEALEGGEVAIDVADEGPGIEARHLPRIFERFYRVDRARSRDQGGTGLGLAIVKHIALVHGGRVEVQSTVGKGSMFRVILPAA